MDEFYTRATIVKERVDRLCAEARRSTSVERIEAIDAEITVCLESLRDIREEQLLAQLPQPKEPPRPRWWRRRR